MRKKYWSILGLALGVLVLGVLVGLMTVNTVAADPTPGIKIQVPRIDVGDVLGTGDWETWIHVQNVSLPDPVTGIEPDTGAIFLGWGDYSGVCPTNDPGVIAHYCQLIRGNAVWTLRGQIDEAVKSGIIYSVRADVFTAACSAAEKTEGDTDKWRCWKEEWEYGTCNDEDMGGGWADPPGAQGEELAVTVTRYGPNDHGTFVSSTYTGISEQMEGEDPPYNYYAPYVMKSYLNQLDTEITIQNSGQDCTSVWIDYMEQGTCYIVYKEHIEQLAPGESVRLKVPTVPGVLECAWPGWLGSAHISAEQPLGIIVDQTSFDVPCGSMDRGTLLTHRARPKVEIRDSEVVTDTLVYADLIFREWSGWEASIQVQNLSVTSQRTFVTVDFMDNSGDEILFLADWVCATGSRTFYLPAVTDLGFNYIGAAEIQSHDQVAFPGNVTPAQPIFAVVDLKRADDPLTPAKDEMGGSYNAHPYSQKEWVSEIALPFTVKDAHNMYTPWTSMIAVRNNSNCNKLKTKIWFKDETGDLLCELKIPWLHPKHVKLIDLDNVGCLYPGYVGAAKVLVEEFEQLCDVDNDGYAENEPLMPSVIVIGKAVGGISGDIINVYEGIPYNTYIPPCYGEIRGVVTDECTGLPANEVNILLDGEIVATTDSTGSYRIEDVEDGEHEVEARKLIPYKDEDSQMVTVSCGEIATANFEMNPRVSAVEVCGLVVDCDDESMKPIDGATVTLNGLSAETTSAGSYCLEGDFAAGTYEVMASMTGFYTCTQPIDVPECGLDFARDFELDCIAPLMVTVEDDCTHIALQDATVTIEFPLCCPEDDEKMTASDLTDSNGEVTLDASRGIVKVTVEADGYNTREVEIQIDTCEGGTLGVSLWPKAWVNGTVKDTTVPKPGVEVRLINVDTGELVEPPLITDENGFVEWKQVEPGWYKLRFFVGGVAKEEIGPFEIFTDDELGAIDRVEFDVDLILDTDVIEGYLCNQKVHSTGQLRECDPGTGDPTGDPIDIDNNTGADEASLNEETAGELLDKTDTSADGRVVFLTTDGAPIGDPVDGDVYFLEFAEDGYAPQGGNEGDPEESEHQTNKNASTMWFQDVCLVDVTP
jgi:hypothetical protein